MLVYKYRTISSGEKILTNGTIRVSKAADFNDPFELSPTIDATSFTPEILREMLQHEHIIDQFYADETAAMNPPMPPAEYRRWYLDPAQLDLRVANQLTKRENNAEFVRAEFGAIFDDNHRLFCASKTKTSILMWSHYAADHKGCLIGFDLDRPPFDDLHEWTIEVQYAPNKPPFAYEPGQMAWRKNMFPVVAAKFDDWAYEKEIRVIFPVLDFVPIPAQTIRCVVLGCRIDPADAKKLRDILNEPRYQHVEIFTAHMEKASFSLRFEQIRAGEQ